MDNLVLRTLVILGTQENVDRVVQWLKDEAQQFENLKGHKPPVTIYERTAVGVTTEVRGDVYKLTKVV